MARMKWINDITYKYKSPCGAEERRLTSKPQGREYAIFINLCFSLSPHPSRALVSVHLLKFLAIYFRRGHLQKYSSPKQKLNLQGSVLSPKHPTTSPSRKIFTLQRSSNPDL